MALKLLIKSSRRFWSWTHVVRSTKMYERKILTTYTPGKVILTTNIVGSPTFKTSFSSPTLFILEISIHALDRDNCSSCVLSLYPLSHASSSQLCFILPFLLKTRRCKSTWPIKSSLIPVFQSLLRYVLGQMKGVFINTTLDVFLLIADLSQEFVLLQYHIYWKVHVLSCIQSNTTPACVQVQSHRCWITAWKKLFNVMVRIEYRELTNRIALLGKTFRKEQTFKRILQG